MSSKYSSNAWKGDFNKVVHMKHCLFCYKTVEQYGDNGDDASGEVDRRSFTAATRLAVCNFLKLTNRLFGKSFDNTVCPCGCGVGSTRQNLFLCCQECLTNVSAFNEYYHQIKCLEMRLSWKLESLRNVMKYADKFPSRVKTFREGLDGLVTIDNSHCCEKCEHESSFTEISGLRQFIFKHCTKYLKGSYPKVQLVRKRCNDYSSGATCWNVRKKAKLGLEYFSSASSSDCEAEAISVVSGNSLSSSQKQKMQSFTSNPSVVDTSPPPHLSIDTANRFNKHVDDNNQEEPSISVPKETPHSCSTTPEDCTSLHSSLESTPVQTCFGSIKTEEQENNVKMEDDQCSLTLGMDTRDSTRLNTGTTDHLISIHVENTQEDPSGSGAIGLSTPVERPFGANPDQVPHLSAEDCMLPDSNVSLEPSPLQTFCTSVKAEEQGNNINTENHQTSSSSSEIDIDDRPRRLRSIHQCPICKMTFSTTDRLQHHQRFAHENRRDVDVESTCSDISLHDDSTDSESSHDEEDDDNQPDNLSDSLSNGNIDFDENENSNDYGSSSESSKDVASDEDYKPSDVEMEDSADEYVSSSAEEQGNDKKEGSRICEAGFGSCDCVNIPFKDRTHLIYKHSNGRITLSETDLQLLQLTTLRQLKLNIISNECPTEDGNSLVCSVSSCLMKFNFPEELENHSKFHGKFACELCDTVNEFAGDFAEHQLEHASSGKSRCCKCDFAEDGQRCIEHYITTHMNFSDQPFNSCPICRQKFHGAFPIPLSHFVNCHDLERLASGSKPVECKVDTCHAYFLKKFQLTEHNLSCHNNNLANNGQRKVRACYRSLISKINSKTNCKKAVHGISIRHARKTRKMRRKDHGRQIVNGISFSDWMNKRGAKYVCSIPKCTQKFLTEYELQIHSKLHGDFSCQFCDEKIKFAKDLAIHELEHKQKKSTTDSPATKGNSIQCSRCNKNKFKGNSRESYSYHFLRKHLKLEMDCFRCPICMAPILGTVHSNLHRGLSDHLKTTHDVSDIPQESVLKCDKCPAHFLKSFQLEKHVQQVHMPIPEKDPTYPCRNCGRQFKTKHKLYSHYSTGSVGCRLSKRELPFVCTANADCRNGFETQEELDRHLHYKMCKQMKAVACQVCGNECLGKSALKIHMRIHNKKKKGRADAPQNILLANGVSMTFGDWVEKKGAKYVCTIPNCTQMFLTDYELQIHSKLHGDFSCQFCDKKTKFAKDLAVHELEHMKEHSETDSPPPKEKSIKCSRCYKNKFNGFSGDHYIYHFLRKHLKLEMDCFRCPICMAPILGTLRSTLHSGLSAHLKTTHNVSKIPPESVVKCDKCPASFLNSVQLKKHIQQVHMPIPEQNPTYPCRNCGRQFKKKMRLYDHYFRGSVGCRMSKQEMPFVCTASADCGFRFETQEELDLHLHYKLCKQIKAVVCEVCGKKCLGKSGLKIHLRMHNKKKKGRADAPQNILLANGVSMTFGDWMKKKGAKFECTIPNCTQKFLTEYELQNHSKLHGDFFCQFCNKKTKFAKDLAVHELEHMKEQAKSDSPPLKEKSIKCSRCNKNKFQGLSGDQYIYHFLRKHLKLEMDCFRCPICMAPILGTSRSSLQSGLRNHLKTTHNVSKISPESVVKCDKCPASFLKSFQLKNHVQQVHMPIPEKDPTYSCRGCGREFENKSKRYMHYYNGPVGCRLSKEEMPFVCTARADCGSRFETQEEFDYHLHCNLCNHTRAVVCQICEKVCLGEAALSLHMRTHNKQNKETHVCDVCGKSFRENSYLRNHMLSHSGPESWRFSCSICSKKFARADKLKLHMNTHTKAKPFVCDVCGEKYAHRHNWRNHMKTKHGMEIPKKPTANTGDKQVSSRKGKKL